MYETIIENATLKERDHESIANTYARLPIGAVVEAHGVWIQTAKGKYLDCVAGLGVNAMGHSHPDLVKAIEIQASRYLHLSNLYLQEPQIKLAELLREQSGCDKVFFTNSGTESIEGAIKVARKYFQAQERTEIYGMHGGFHGRSYGPLSIMDKLKYKDGFGPFLPGLASLSQSEILARVSGKTAAVIVEPIQGEGGIVPLPDDFVVQLQTLREKFGFLIIADEIQSGLGRTGYFLASESVGLRPDFIVVAKALGGGLPLGAILLPDSIAATLPSGTHGTTFGGNALACAAGIVILEAMPQLIENARNVGTYLRTKLLELKSAYPNSISDVRAHGLMIGVEMKNAAHVQKQLLAHSIITNVTAEYTLRLLPPLIFTIENADQLLTALEEILFSEGATSLDWQ